MSITWGRFLHEIIDHVRQWALIVVMIFDNRSNLYRINSRWHKLHWNVFLAFLGIILVIYWWLPSHDVAIDFWPLLKSSLIHCPVKLLRLFWRYSRHLSNSLSCLLYIFPLLASRLVRTFKKWVFFFLWIRDLIIPNNLVQHLYRFLLLWPFLDRIGINNLRFNSILLLGFDASLEFPLVKLRFDLYKDRLEADCKDY